ncbi:hypothetical protein DF185_03410 [Marinifilum breve]|uniref:Uncharacterized protein n=1 Tax=Marinifilum breve TaxID=2184082 RepID=A0A2V4A358_9BACT|nr:hypothetical protein [Marinifilum breve]PXY03146.1 hypothetical protein DF185_03410 [Marinifilum breve]
MKSKSILPKKIVIWILIVLVIIIGVYVLTLFFFNHNSELSKRNEFGDYIGGILNPLFTLLSTTAIIFLTYMLGKNEDLKAEKAIETQKRITLNQMRQDALNKLVDKLNLFASDMHRMSIMEPDTLGIVKAFISKKNKEKEEKDIIVWIIIANELDSFLQLEYLFKDLFDNEDFLKSYEDLYESTMKLLGEQGGKMLIEQSSLENYVKAKQDLITRIGSFIYAEF